MPFFIYLISYKCEKIGFLAYEEYFIDILKIQKKL